MSLIKCPECNKEVSDKAHNCIHCGFILEDLNICNINGTPCDLSIILNIINKESDGLIIRKIRDIYNMTPRDANKLYNMIIETGKIPENFTCETIQPSHSNKPKCPTCNSTNISKVSTMSKAGSVAMWGLLSQKVKKTFHCNNCKYEW